MLFVVQFRDAPEKLHLRSELMAAHLTFLKTHDTVIRVAGSLRREADDSPAGGLWVVAAADFAAVRTLYAGDPFWQAGLRASVEIHRLAKAFPDISTSV